MKHIERKLESTNATDKGLDDQSFFNTSTPYTEEKHRSIPQEFFMRRMLGIWNNQPKAPNRIVLTGGPSGGKSTLQRAIASRIQEAYCAPEVATMLLSGGFPAPNQQHPWEITWQRNFQRAVAGSQIALESISADRAKREAKHLTVFDRGLLDGASYLPGGVAELEDITGQDEEVMLNRYDTVLHLPTTAAHQAYDKQSNPHRFEEAEAALELEDKVMAAWANHPNRIILGETDKDARIARGLDIIGALSRGR